VLPFDLCEKIDDCRKGVFKNQWRLFIYPEQLLSGENRHPALKLKKNPYLDQDYFKKRNTVLKTRMRVSMGEILPPNLILKPFSSFWNA
jgi:hypothetical protein